MKTKLFAILAALVAIGPSLGLAGAAHADLLADIKAKGKIVSATEMHYAPFDLLKDGEYQGICHDLFTEVAKELGVEVEFLDLPWQSVLPGLEAGKFDIVNAPVTITADRMKRYRFTLPIGDATVALAKKAGDADIARPEDIAGKAVGSEKGSVELENLKTFSASLPTPADVRGYVTMDEALADLAVGRIQAAANSLTLMGYAAARRPNLFELVTPPFGPPQYYGWVTRPGDESASLVRAINAVLIKMHGDGRMKAINEKWIGAAPDLPTTMPTLE